MRVFPMIDRGYRRRLRLGLPTILGLVKRGFFIPHRHAGGAGDAAGYPALEPLFRAAEPAFAELLATIGRYGEALAAIGVEPPPQPRWRQSWFPRLDAAAAYALVRSRRPARIVEVGCGHSTRFFARAIADEGLATRLLAIDPAPRAHLLELPVQLVKQPLQRVDPDVFAALRPEDVLAIDSSHVLMPGTDVDILLNRVLPGLPAGVLVHIHDVFLPDGYPQGWDWRGYNEQLAVGALIHGGGWRLLWSSHYVASRMAGRVSGHFIAGLGMPSDAVESSVWLEKIAGAYGEPAGSAATSAGTKNR